MTTPELQAKVAVWRAKALEGTLSLEEQIEAVRITRGTRMAALTTSESKRRTRAKAEIKSADEMLDEL